MKREVVIFLIALASLLVSIESLSIDHAGSLIADSKSKMSKSVQNNLLKIQDIMHSIMAKVFELDESSCKSNLVELLKSADKMMGFDNAHCGLIFERKVSNLPNSVDKIDTIKEGLKNHENAAFDCLMNALTNSKEISIQVKNQIGVCEKWNRT